MLINILRQQSLPSLVSRIELTIRMVYGDEDNNHSKAMMVIVMMMTLMSRLGSSGGNGRYNDADVEEDEHVIIMVNRMITGKLSKP